MRSKLRTIGLHTNRILDIYYPDNNIIGLLVHNDYVATVVEAFQSLGIEEDWDFDPLSPSVLRDPKLASLTDDQKFDKLCNLLEVRLVAVINRHKNPTTRYSLARAFCLQNWIAKDKFSSLFPPRSKPSPPSNSSKG